jgi:hypothetical protein
LQNAALAVSGQVSGIDSHERVMHTFCQPTKGLQGPTKRNPVIAPPSFTASTHRWMPQPVDVGEWQDVSSAVCTS